MEPLFVRSSLAMAALLTTVAVFSKPSNVLCQIKGRDDLGDKRT